MVRKTSVVREHRRSPKARRRSRQRRQLGGFRQSGSLQLSSGSAAQVTIDRTLVLPDHWLSILVANLPHRRVVRANTGAPIHSTISESAGT